VWCELLLVFGGGGDGPGCFCGGCRRNPVTKGCAGSYAAKWSFETCTLLKGLGPSKVAAAAEVKGIREGRGCPAAHGLAAVGVLGSASAEGVYGMGTAGERGGGELGWIGPAAGRAVAWHIGPSKVAATAEDGVSPSLHASLQVLAGCLPG
jgi:hypothetical protein